MNAQFQAKQTSSSRIHCLDGLRGIAITAVILFHAFARWPNLYAYGDKFVNNAVLNTQLAGVNLFFIISGFVILMTLRKCKSFFDFLIRRWLRLFPAMLICSLLVLFSSGLFPERPAGQARFWDLLPGLTFLGDGLVVHHLWDLFSQFTYVVPNSIEGAFWSLYVEVKFYIIFGAAYFLFGELAGICLIFGLFIVGMEKFLFVRIENGGRLAHALGLERLSTGWPHDLFSLIDKVADLFIFKSYGFFGTGALLFLYYDSGKQIYFIFALIIGLLSAVTLTDTTTANVVFVLLICIAVHSDALRELLANRALVFVGFVSYPLYLIHENMMVAMIVKIGSAFPNMPALIIPILPICVVVILAWLIATFLEPTTKRLLQLFLRPSHASNIAKNDAVPVVAGE
jgi:peptidoglycan/LPS O-acetylase OafA/YrhL